jgi:hypothetical protein
MPLEYSLDANHKAIIAALRYGGCRVIETPGVGRVIPGFPDALAVCGPVVAFVEIKSDKGKLRPEQARFRDGLLGWYSVVRSVDDALALARALREAADRLVC